MRGVSINLCSCYSAVAANRRHDASGIKSFLTPGTRASRRCLTSFLTVTGEMDKRFAAARMSSNSGCGCGSFTSEIVFPVLTGAISALSFIDLLVVISFIKLIRWHVVTRCQVAVCGGGAATWSES